MIIAQQQIDETLERINFNRLLEYQTKKTIKNQCFIPINYKYLAINKEWRQMQIKLLNDETFQ